MKKTEQKVLKFIDDQKLIDENDKVLVALSGGPDSVFLLHFLKKYSKKFKISLAAIHINHKLRGKDADKDELFCKALCGKLNIRFYSFKKNIKAVAAKKKISMEEAGRLIRYKEFENTLTKAGCTKIATAHNADENAETVLLNIIKGSGIRGISGIPPKRDNIIRPLLILTKNEIFGYLNYHKTGYRTDLTNLESDAERNFLRNRVIPLIEERLNPSLSNTLLKSSEVFRNINNLIKKKVDEAAGKLISKRKNYISLSLNELNKVEKEYLGEVFRFIFEREFLVHLAFDDCKKIIRLMQNQSGKSIQIFDKIKVVKERAELIIYKEEPEEGFKALSISEGDSIKINNKKLSIKKKGTRKLKVGSNKNLEFVNADALTQKFLIRRWEPGDRFHPFGMKGTKKISDFLNEQKIPSSRKKEQMILLNEDRVVWVIGLRLDERFRITSETKKVLELCLS